jgi:hypothetical protein
VRVLVAAGARASFPDLRGFGASDKPRGKAAYENSAMTRDVAALGWTFAGPVCRVHFGLQADAISGDNKATKFLRALVCRTLPSSARNAFERREQKYLPREVRPTIRKARSSALSTRLTRLPVGVNIVAVVDGRKNLLRESSPPRIDKNGPTV